MKIFLSYVFIYENSAQILGFYPVGLELSAEA